MGLGVPASVCGVGCAGECVQVLGGRCGVRCASQGEGVGLGVPDSGVRC